MTTTTTTIKYADLKAALRKIIAASAPAVRDMHQAKQADRDLYQRTMAHLAFGGRSGAPGTDTGSAEQNECNKRFVALVGDHRSIQLKDRSLRRGAHLALSMLRGRAYKACEAKTEDTIGNVDKMIRKAIYLAVGVASEDSGFVDLDIELTSGEVLRLGGDRERLKIINVITKPKGPSRTNSNNLGNYAELRKWQREFGNAKSLTHRWLDGQPLPVTALHARPPREEYVEVAWPQDHAETTEA